MGWGGQHLPPPQKRTQASGVGMGVGGTLCQGRRDWGEPRMGGGGHPGGVLGWGDRGGGGSRGGHPLWGCTECEGGDAGGQKG